MNIPGNIHFLSPSSDVTGFTSSGDLAGNNLSGLTISSLKGSVISAATPTEGQVFSFNSGKYTPQTHAGDVTGSVTSMAVTGIRGIVVAPTLPTITQVLTYDGNKWTPSAVSQGSTTLVGDATGSIGSNSVTGIRGFVISPTAPTITQVLTYDGNKWTPSGTSINPLTLIGDVTGTTNSNSVTGIRGISVTTTTPTINQAIVYRGQNYQPSTLSGSDIIVSMIGNASLSTNQLIQNAYRSSGIYTGGNIVSSNASANTVSICAAQISIRSTTSITASMYSYDFSGTSSYNIPLATTQFIGIYYNSGNPSLTSKSSNTWDYVTEFPLAVVTNTSGHVDIANVPQKVGDHVAMSLREYYETNIFERDSRDGGLLISDSNDNQRHILITSGSVWERLNRFTFAAFNSGSGTPFTIWWQNGSGGFSSSSMSQWDSLHYDDGTGTLHNLANNKYAVMWFYIEPTDGDVNALYGRGTYNNTTAAALEAPPTTYPDQIKYQSVLNGRIIFQQAANLASQVDSVYNMVFSIGQTIIVSMAGDVTGNSNAASVVKLSNTNISPTIASAATSQNYALIWDNSNSQWTASAQNSVTSLSLLGDVTGTTSSNSVTGIRGIVVSTAVPTSTQVLTYDGAKWTPSGILTNIIGSSGLVTLTNGTVISVGIQNASGDITGSITANSVTAIRGIVVSPTLPTITQVLTYDGSKWTPSAVSQGAGGTLIGDVTGTLAANSVTAIRGFLVTPTAPTATQVLTYDGAKYVPSGIVSNVIGSSGLVTLINGSVISVGIQNAAGDVTGSITANSVTGIRGIAISPTAPTTTQVLTYDGTRWTPSGTSTNPLTLIGDVTGTTNNSSVTAVRGFVVSPTAPTSTQVLTYDGNKYVPSGIISSVIGSSGLVTLVNGSVISVGIQNTVGDVTGSITANSVTGIRGVVISPTTPTITQVLTYDGSKWTPSGITQGGSTVLAGDVTGNSGNVSVTAIRGILISPTAPTSTQVLTYDGSKYTPSGVISNVIGASGLVTLANGSVISVGIQNAVGDITGSITANAVTAIRGVVISPSAPTITQVLTYDGNKWTPSGITQGGSTVLAGDVTGNSGNVSVTAIRGILVSPIAPTSTQVLTYDGSKYTASGIISNIIGASGAVTLVNGSVISVGIQNIVGDVTGSITSNSVTAIRGVVISPTAPTITQVLTYDGTKWTPSGTSINPLTLVGDVTGASNSNSVTGIRGIVVSPTAPTTTQVLTYDGNKYVASGVISNVIGASGAVTLVNGSVISIGIQNAAGDITGSITANSVTAIRGVVISPTAPTITQVLTYDGTKWAPSGTSINPLTLVGDVTGTTNSNSVTGIRGIVVAVNTPQNNQQFVFNTSNNQYALSTLFSSVTTTTANTTATLSSYIINLYPSGAAINVMLFAASNYNNGFYYTFKDSAGSAQTNNITISSSTTASKIDGMQQFVISANYGSVTLYTDGSNWFTDTVTVYSGDVTGGPEHISVTGIRGISVNPTLPTITQVLTYDGTRWTPSGTSTNPLTLLGDVTGTTNSNSVTAIRGFWIDPTAPTNGDIFFYKGDRWAHGTVGGDITGSVTSMAVTGIRGIVVSPTAPTTTQVLTYDGSKYTPSGVISNVIGASGLVTLINGSVISVGIKNTVGDVTGSITANSVTGIRGIVVSPTAPTTTQVLTYDGSKYTPSGVISNVIGASGLVTLVNGSVISVGVQNMVGDTTGSLTANSVTAIRGVVISPAAPTITQVLTYDGTKWTPSGTSINPLTLVGDVTGTTNSNSVTGIRGIVVSPSGPANNQQFVYNSNSLQWSLSTLYSAVTSTSANYTAISTGYIVNLISSGGAITVTLLGASNYANGFYYTFKDSSGSAQKNNITITSSTTASKIDGAQLFTISANYGAVSLYNDGINWFTESTTVEGGDITGGPGYISVTGIRGIVVSPTAPTTTQVLTYDGSKYTPSGVISNVIGSSGLVTLINGSVISVGIQNTVGDVTGSITANSVTGIRGIVVSPTAPTITQVLTYDGNKWTPSGITQGGSTVLAGDVTGNSGNVSVTAIRGILVSPTAPTSTQVLTYDGSKYVASGVISNVIGASGAVTLINGSVISVGIQNMVGDTTGSITANSVTAIRGIVVSPTAPTITQVLTYDGIKWSPSAITQGGGSTLNGDVTGQLTSNSVTAIRGNVFSPTAPTISQSYEFNGTIFNPLTRGGDVTGSISALNVTGIRGVVVSTVAPTITQVLTYDGNKWTPSAISQGAGGTLVGDVTGALGSNSVTGIRGIVVTPTAPTITQVLTYDGTNWSPSGITQGQGIGITWNDSNNLTAQTMAVNSGYISDSGTNLTVYTLPTTVATGSIFWVTSRASGGWKVAQNAAQYIRYLGIVTTTGTAGFLMSIDNYSSVQLLCTSANTEFTAIGGLGSLSAA